MKIELSFPTVMSLFALSSAGSEESEEEVSTLDNPLSMSDEEIENMSPEQFAAANADKSDDDEDEDEDENEDQENDQEEEEEESNLGDDDQDEDSDNEADEEEAEDVATSDDSDQAKGSEGSEKNQPSEEELATNAKTYEAAYQDLFGQPIKASGRETQLRNVEHARSLIEMGVDYNKKMQHMRPHMQALKTLEKEGLLEDKDMLNLLLEAKQGKPEAIRRLIGDAKIDMVDLADDDDSPEYTPENHIVSETEVEIENVLSTIRESPSYQKTIDVMTNTFDSKSKEIMSQNPQYIQSLNQDIDSGVYDKVMDMVQYQKDIKAIPTGTSDIEAYISTVQQMAAYEQSQEQKSIQEQATASSKTNTSKSSNKRRKVGMSNSRSSKKKEPNFDPMAAMDMSDEDFMKQYGKQLR